MYNTQGDVTECRAESWVSDNWQISSAMRYTITYNPDNTKDNVIIELYNTSGSSWNNYKKELFSYTAGNKSQTIEQTYTGGNWVNANKIWNYQYQGYYTTYYETQNWKGGTWYDSIKVTTAYDANFYGYVITTEEKYTTGSWQNYSRVTSTYDSHNNYNGFKTEDWDGSAWQISYESKYIFTYNISGDITEEIYQTWDFMGGGLVNDERYLYYNHQHFGSIHENAATVAIEVYPNPVTDYLNVKVQGAGMLRLADMQGRLVYQEYFGSKMQTVVSVAVAHLSEGIYQLSIINGSHVRSAKVMVKR